VIGGVPAKVIRRLVPGEGWIRPEGPPDARPASRTIAPDDLADALAELEQITAADEAEIAAGTDPASG
jgi:aminoglycoside phosphotransferase (APT) family kinase protein